MTTGISGRATAPSVAISIRGARSPIGGEPSPFSNPDRKLIQTASASGAPAMRGGHVLVLGATDRRIRAVVSQVPTISGYEQGLRRVPPEAIAALEHLFDEDERAPFRGEPPRRQAIVSRDPSVPASCRSQDAIDLYLQQLPAGVRENNVTAPGSRGCPDAPADGRGAERHDHYQRSCARGLRAGPCSRSDW